MTVQDDDVERVEVVKLVEALERIEKACDWRYRSEDGPAETERVFSAEIAEALEHAGMSLDEGRYAFDSDVRAVTLSTRPTTHTACFDQAGEGKAILDTAPTGTAAEEMETVARIIEPGTWEAIDASRNGGPPVAPGAGLASLHVAKRVLATLTKPAALPKEGEEVTDEQIVVLMYELHAHLPEEKRPMSMSDLSDEQAGRVRNAIRAVSALPVSGEVDGHHYIHWPRERFCWFKDQPAIFTESGGTVLNERKARPCEWNEGVSNDEILGALLDARDVCKSVLAEFASVTDAAETLERINRALELRAQEPNS